MKIGLVIMLAENKALGRAATYAEIREFALQAEQGAFDAVWLYDHLLYRPEKETIGIWECWTMLSALAEATHRVELGTLVLCNSFRNPAILAKMAHTVDEVSGGRLILGIGAGWNQPEYEAFGLPFDHRVDRFEEALQIIRPLLKEGRVDFEGKYYQARDCEITPRGPRPSGIPVMIGADGPRMLRLTAQYADLWNSGYYGKFDTFREMSGKMDAACLEVGRDPAALGKSALLFLYYPDLGGPPTFDQMYLTGSDEEVAGALREYEQMGIEQVMLHLVPFTAQSVERAVRAVQLYRSLA